MGEFLQNTSLSPFLTVVPAVYNEWCRDLVSPMLQLLRSALAARKNFTGAAGADDVPEKFVFISSSTLPLKPFHIIHEEFGKHPYASDICIKSSLFWPMAKNNTMYKVSATQWVVLAREDAEALVHNLPEPVPEHAVEIPLVENVSFQDFQPNYWCPDETDIFTFTFGPWLREGTAEEEVRRYPGIGPLRFGQRPGTPIVQGCCRTWLFFAESPGVLKKYVLVEMIGQAGDLLTALKADPQGQLLAPVTHDVEALYKIQALGPIGMQALRRSSFLFARKFVRNASLPGYAQHVFKG